MLRNMRSMASCAPTPTRGCTNTRPSSSALAMHAATLGLLLACMWLTMSV
jgi:hypothetical protein